MPSDIAGLRRDRAKASDRMSDIVTAARGRSMTDDEQRDFGAAADEVKALDEKITAAEAEATTTTTATTTISRADAAEIAKLCAESGQPGMSAKLLAEGVSVDEAKTRINAAGEITNMVASARAKDATIPENFAATMISEGKSVEQVRTALFDKLVASESATSIISQTPFATSPAAASATASAASMERELKRAGLKKEA